MTGIAWWRWAVVGALGTVVMDLLGGAARASGVTHGVPPELIVRWLAHAAKGQLFVADIRTAAGGGESLLSFLPVHYAIGTTFGLLLGALARLAGGRADSAAARFAFGVSTTAVPAFLMFPGMGLGVLGTGAPSEWLVPRTAIVNHVFFGIGLAVVARFLIPRTFAPRPAAEK